VSLIVILFMVSIVVVTVMGIFYFQYWATRDGMDCKFAVGDRYVRHRFFFVFVFEADPNQSAQCKLVV
jgi:hypothetical protein